MKGVFECNRFHEPIETEPFVRIIKLYQNYFKDFEESESLMRDFKFEGPDVFPEINEKLN